MWMRSAAGTTVRQQRLRMLSTRSLLREVFPQLPESIVQHLKWMDQKRRLKQDMLLLGPPPTNFTRRIALEFAARHNVPVEVVSLTADTTESDLKTRRDLVQQTVRFSDQAPVRAALQGKILILDGLEKCERNVLPTLNNLLENREINLDDGRLIVSHQRFQALLKHTSEEVLRRSGIVSSHPDFQVIALSVPTPPYIGRPLDPPLRSRFQVRRVDFPPVRELLDAGFNEFAVKLSSALNTACDRDPKMFPRFPDLNVLHVSKMLKEHPHRRFEEAFSYSYPWLNNELRFPHRKALQKLFEDLPKRKGDMPETTFKTDVFLSPQRQQILRAMQDDLDAGRDVLLCGDLGSGKSLLARMLAGVRKQKVSVFALYKDMTARDLIARRSTDGITGDTTWEPSPLVKAAMDGDLLVLDGIEKVESAILSVARLFQDRELDYVDGTRVTVSPAFRVIALATIGGADKKSSTAFLTPEMVSMFSFHLLPLAQKPSELEELFRHEFPKVPRSSVQTLLDLSRLLESKGADAGLGKLSLRSMFRIFRLMEAFPNENIMNQQIKRVFLEPFLPQSQRELLRRLLAEAQIVPLKNSNDHPLQNKVIVTESLLSIGPVSGPRMRSKGRADLVPNVLFYDVPHHRQTLREMLVDFVSGFRNLLLIGNQGVGKNKLCDRMLELLNAEREYIQLHRDSTVAGLIGAPTLRDGQVIWEDSPLVRAAKVGRVLVVDEADKAPPEVVAVLKSLVEDGDMLLGNGKRLVRRKSAENEIQIHPEFCVWILSNRPGFPFHGNDFFKQVGDVFSTHIVENPDLQSEFELLRSYAPTTSADTLITLARCFADLRALADEGIIAYPYSTREAVNVAKHIEAFPEDGLVSALHNVLDFDSFRPEIARLLAKVFQKHGVPFVFEHGTLLGTNLGVVQKLPEMKPSGEVWRAK